MVAPIVAAIAGSLGGIALADIPLLKGLLGHGEGGNGGGGGIGLPMVLLIGLAIGLVAVVAGFLAGDR